MGTAFAGPAAKRECRPRCTFTQKKLPPWHRPNNWPNSTAWSGR